MTRRQTPREEQSRTDTGITEISLIQCAYSSNRGKALKCDGSEQNLKGVEKAGFEEPG